MRIAIEVSQMQLKTNANDSYTWERMKEKEYLFFKNLNDLSSDRFKNLCDDVNKSFIIIYKISVQSLPQTQNEKRFIYIDYSSLYNV